MGQGRYQISLLLPSVDEYVSETNPVRAVDAYVATFDLVGLEMQNVVQSLTDG